jgi:hypothetical protein
MIVVQASVPPPEQVKRRRWWLTFLVLVMVAFASGAVLGGKRPSAPPPSLATWSPSVPSVPRTPRASAVSVISQIPPPNVLRLPGRVPARASGTFVYAPGNGRVLGRKGPIRRFRVAVERGSGENVAAFAAQVEATLGDTRSWIGAGRFRLQRVSHAVPADFTVFLATRYEAGKMCASGGANITIGGVPYTSCRTAGRAIINLDRWRLSARPYLAAKVPLVMYRHYVVNHEVGHELGHRHEGCPKRGGRAPVMVQQTLTLRGCLPNPWPRVRNRPLSGPLL